LSFLASFVKDKATTGVWIYLWSFLSCSIGLTSVFVSNDFFFLDLKPKATKTKKSQLALHQTKKLLHSKKKKKR